MKKPQNWRDKEFGRLKRLREKDWYYWVDKKPRKRRRKRMKDKNRLAQEYCNNTKIVNHLTPEEWESGDAAIYNLQFMSFCAGFEKAIEIAKQDIKAAFEAGQRSIGYKDESFTRIDQTIVGYLQSKPPCNGCRMQLAVVGGYCEDCHAKGVKEIRSVLGEVLTPMPSGKPIKTPIK